MTDADKVFQEQQKKDSPSLKKTVFSVPRHILLLAIIFLAVLGIAYYTKSLAWLTGKIVIIIIVCVICVLIIVGSSNQPEKPERMPDEKCRALLLRELLNKQKSGLMPRGSITLSEISSGNDNMQGYEIGWSLTADYITQHIVSLVDWYDGKYVTSKKLDSPYEGDVIFKVIPKYIPITSELFYKTQKGA